MQEAFGLIAQRHRDEIEQATGKKTTAPKKSPFAKRRT